MNSQLRRVTAVFLAQLLILLTANALAGPADSVTSSTIEGLPILTYDTDTGIGYGAKGFTLNCFGVRESFDLVLFNSSKGERWYHFVFSIPDFEIRQGTAYPVALDVTIDYDKWIHNSFFGIGNSSSFSHREYYTKEPIEFSLLVSRGISHSLVGLMGMKYRAVRNFGFSPSSRLVVAEPSLNASRVSCTSLLFSARYDTRDSYVNPTGGLVIQGEIEHTPDVTFNDVAFTRVSVLLQHYSPIRSPAAVLALRLGVQGLSGNNLPVQVLLPIGGGGTLRGSPQDRYLDKASVICNLELRFPFLWRFGGVVGADAGKVWSSISKLDLGRWATNPLAGLRFSMDTFVVRLDVGFGKETTGFYLNFGQLF